jgi:hypothetical protein
MYHEAKNRGVSYDAEVLRHLLHGSSVQCRVACDKAKSPRYIQYSVEFSH